jgi:hypothetical protein
MSNTTKEDWYVRLPADLYGELVKIAKSEDRSISSTARVLVREALKRRQEGAGA